LSRAKGACKSRLRLASNRKDPKRNNAYSPTRSKGGIRQRRFCNPAPHFSPGKVTAADSFQYHYFALMS
jgi:hypothetical protein